MSVLSYTLRTIREPFQRWAESRRPRGASIELNQKRIFIFPSAAGGAFLLVALLLLLIGTNYENNLIHAVAFLLLSLFVLSIIHTYGNLSGIRVTAKESHSCFAGEQAEFVLNLTANGKRVRENVQLAWKGGTPQTVKVIDTDGCRVRLYHPAPKRGRLKPEPLLIESTFPLGLLRAWSWLEIEASAVIYPAPLEVQMAKSQALEGGDGAQQAMDGGEDFSGFTQYQPGMPLRHVAWKAYARGRGLHAKTYHAQVDDRTWLNWEAFSGQPTEMRLSSLCYLVNQLEKHGDHYGLRLPGKSFEPDRGEQHRKRLLTALALYPGDQG